MHRKPVHTLLAFACVLACGVALAAMQWHTDPTKSMLTFVGNQAGADFEGVFHKFAADIRFDPADLSTAKFDVTIDLRSLDTQDKERDGIMRGSDIFAVDRWPTAHYVADHFTSTGKSSYRADGTLTLRDVSRPVPIEFTFESGTDGAWLKGSAKLNRLDFGVGQGEWKDTTWVKNEVRVKFALRLNKG